MKKLFTLLSLLVIGGAVMGQISGYPYMQDFESFSTCTPTCQTACALSAFWNNDQTDNTDWSVDQGGTTSGNTGPTTDHNPGTTSGNYLYIETSSPCNNNGFVANLESPWFDFTSVTTPTVSFWYHMFGASMGTMHFDVDTANGGNWILDVVPSWTDNRDEWQEQIVFLNSYAGYDSVRFRIRGIVGTSFTSDMAVDNFLVFDLPAVDVGVSAIDSPATGGCNLGQEDVTITITNFGGDTLTAGTQIPVSYSNGTTTVTDTITLTSDLNGLGGSVSYTFGTQIDLSTPGDYFITAWTGLSGDTTTFNDSTMSGVIQSIPTVSTLPYLEDFENGTGGWSAGGPNASWQYGTFAGTTIGPGPTCGADGWATNLSGGYQNNEDSYLRSPCLDFSGLTTDPNIRFLLNLDIESFFDALWVETSTDGGVTWTKLGLTGGMGTNWYNTTDNDWDGTTGWRIAEHPLTGLAGQPNAAVRFRFNSDGSVTPEGAGIDDVIIYSGSIEEAFPLALLAPETACGLSSADSVTALFVNSGSDTIPGLPVCYVLDNGTPVCDSIIGPIAPFDTVMYTFSTPGDFSAVGQHNVRLYTSLANDLNSCNDTLDFIVENVPLVNSFPYLETFENGTGFFNPVGATSFAFGTPAKTTIQGAGSGVNAWVTGGLGATPYNTNEQGAVISPCFDMTQADTASWVALKIWWNSEFSWDGSNLQYSTDDGVSWTNIGIANDPFNWYNDFSINADPGGSQEGWTGRTSSSNGSGGWVIAKHKLDSAIFTQAQVQYRITFASDGSVQDDGVAFDDFAIGVPTQISLGPDTTVCSGFSLGTDLGMVGQGWEWSNGDDTPFTTLINADSVARVDTISIIYTDTLGLCTYDTVVVTVDPAPYIDFPDTSICWNATITLDASPSGATDYLWNIPDTSSIVTVNVGTWSVALSDPSVNSCVYTETVTISAHPVANIGSDTLPYCPGDTVTLDAGVSGATYLWNGNPADTLQTLMVSMDGSYSVVVSDTNGCISSDTVTTMAEAPADLGPDVLLCDGTTETLDPGVVGSSWVWSTGDTTATIDVNTAGTYAVTVFSQLGCLSSDSIEITTAVTPSAAFTATNTGNVTFDFTDNSTGTPTSWSWDFGDGSTDNTQNPTHVYPAVDSSYTVTLIVSNSCGADTLTQTQMVTGVEDLLPAGSVAVYPNPNNGTFFVDLKGLNGTASVEVLNLYGQTVQAIDLGIVLGDRTENLSIEHAKGVYFVKVTVEGQSSYNRIVVQ